MMRKISNVRARAGGLGLGLCLSLSLGGCSAADDYLDDFFDDFKPGHGGGHGGSSSGPPPGDCGFVTWDDVYETIERDVLTRDAEDRPFLRYVSLANEQSGTCDNLIDPVAALNDVLELTSRGNLAPEPALISGDVLIYRLDLRDYDWDDVPGPLTVGGTTFVDVWEAIVTASPFAVEFEGDAAENIILQTGTLKPVIFADAFVSVTSRGPIFAALGGSGTSGSIEEVQDDFDADVFLAGAAGDLLYPAENLQRDIPRFNPALSGLDDGFAVDRDDWATLYLESLCISAVADENRPTDEVCASIGF
jgi:hypothetical protein